MAPGAGGPKPRSNAPKTPPNQSFPIQPQSAYSYAGKLYDEGAAVLPFKNHQGEMLIVKGAREAAREFDAPGNLLDDFHRAYGCEPDGWALLTGPHGYVVIDCEDYASFRAACFLFPLARKTYGSKGGHVHLRVNEPVSRASYYNSSGELSFEVLTDWMVTLPGSIHRKTGKAYRVVQDGPAMAIDVSDLERAIEIMRDAVGGKQPQD